MSLIENGISVYKASELTGVPQTTFKDRRLGNISKDCFYTGAPTVFTAEEEAKLKNRVIEMSSMGYGYT